MLRTSMLIKLCIHASDLNYCFRDIFAVGMICCDGEGRLNEKVHHAAMQVEEVPGVSFMLFICINQLGRDMYIRNSMIK